MFSIRQFREAPIAVTNSDCPLAYEVLSLAIVDEACRFNYVESRTKLRLVTADDNERPAMKYVRVGERIWPPEVVLAVPVAQGKAEGVDRRMIGQVKADFSGQCPTRDGDDGFDALVAKICSNFSDGGGERLPTPASERRVDAANRHRALWSGWPGESGVKRLCLDWKMNEARRGES